MNIFAQCSGPGHGGQVLIDGVPISVLYPNKRYLPEEAKAVLDFLLEVTRFEIWGASTI